MDGDSAESLRAALEAGTLSPAEYVQRARTAGIDTSTVASVLRSTVVAASCNKSSASDQAPVGDAESDSLTSALPAEPGSAEASLAWLRARPENWARRAAERLAPDNDFLIDLDLYDAGLLNDVCNHILEIADLKLSCFKGNLAAFVKVRPEARAYFELKSNKLKFHFPKPGPIEGADSA